MRRAVWLSVSFGVIVFHGLSLRGDEVSPTPVPAADVAYETSEAPATAASPANVPDLSGPWCGSWQSCTNGHNGPMNAQFCKRCDGHYDVTFKGRFFKLIPFHYSTTLNVTGYGPDGKVYLSGSHFLGPLMGTFCYNAWADNCHFVASYSARRDNGQFVMSR